MYPKKIALVDIGTLKVKIQLREYLSKDEMKVLYQTSVRTALGRDWLENNIPEGAIFDTINAINMAKIAMDKFGIFELHAIGTEALRKADNGLVVLEQIKNQTSVEPELLDQATEAKLFFEAVKKDFPNTPITTLDVGGGSAQIVISDQPINQQSFLFPTGTYNIRTEYIDGNQPTESGFLLAKEYIFNTLLPIKNLATQSKYLVVGSTIALDFFQEILLKFNLPNTSITHSNHPLMINTETIKIILEKLALLPYSERENLFSLEPAYTWGVDITILHILAVCEYLNITNIIPTNHNLSSGLFSKYLK